MSRPQLMLASDFYYCKTKTDNRQKIGISECVLVVLVLYQRHFEDTPCATAIGAWLDQAVEEGARLRLTDCLVYDNSPTPSQTNINGHARATYVHDPCNGGTRAAYIAATDMAARRGCGWILFLDHDTALPANFFRAASDALTQAEAQSDRPIAAVIPYVYDGSVQVSPSLVRYYGRVSRFSVSRQGASGKYPELTAIASASLVQTRCLSSLLPIPAAFKLDYLDHWLFREIQRRGGAMAISSARIEHSLSVCSMKSMDVGRYRAILAAELLFLQGDATYSKASHLLWHILRAAKLALLTRRIPLLLVCWEAARKIISKP